MRTASLVVAVAALANATAAVGQQVQTLELPGRSTARVKSRIQGKAYADFRVSLKAGRTLSVDLRAGRTATYFNVLAPGNPTAMHNGSMTGNRLENRQVPITGTYTIRVYQMGAAADGGRISAFELKVSARGTGLTPIPSSRDATLPGTRFHARAPVHCSIVGAPERRDCVASVVRYPGGSATVELRAGKQIRRVLFVKGRPAAHDSSEAFTYSRSGEDTVVRFGDAPSEEYVLPDALVLGG